MAGKGLLFAGAFAIFAAYRMAETVQPIETFVVDVQKRVTDALVLRVSQLMVELTQLIRQAYEAKFRVNNAAGAASALTFEVNRTVGFIEAVIGAGKPNSYLRYLEYGVRGTKSSPPGGALYSRSKAPPLQNIYQWVRAAALPVPKWMVDRAKQNAERAAKGEKLDAKRPWYSEVDPVKMLAYWTMIGIKQRGTPALRIIQRVLQQQSNRIQSVLAGA